MDEAATADGEDPVEQSAGGAALLGGQADGNTAPHIGHKLGGIQERGQHDAGLRREVEVTGDDEPRLTRAAG
jgi:hypothetical protein